MESKAEQEGLFHEILIPVTAFFRDSRVFTLLQETILPILTKDKSATDPLRIWVAGCSTGEEAYSLAICVEEHCNAHQLSLPVQIFATDISEISINRARSGIYKKKDLAGVSEARIKSFFNKSDGAYQVNKRIREMVVFAVQNFLTDPPFSRIDLVTCRNVLIYMQPYLQKKALSTFHYALNNSGYLLLGKSETTGMDSYNFTTIHKGEKLYKVNPGTVKRIKQVQTRAMDIRRDAELARKETEIKDDLQLAADNAMHAAFPVSGVIINDQLDILHFRGSTGDYLEAAPGKANYHLLRMARPGLAFELRNAIYKARQEKKPVLKNHVVLENRERSVDIQVLPLEHHADTHFLVLFRDSITQPLSNLKGEKEGEDESVSQARVDQLEHELSQIRRDIHAILEDQESVNAELQSANEELLSGSEELQSLNEELETSKEEIQSSNEELAILNAELIERNEQVVQARKYAEAIITTIHEPIIVLTGDFGIRTANNSFNKKFNLDNEQLEGKKFFEISSGFWRVPELEQLLKKILPGHSRFERFEMVVQLPGRPDTTLTLNARQLVNEYSNEPLILLAIHDITDQKFSERQLELQVQERTTALRTANVELQQLNDNLRQFASITSHDLQEPLRKMKTFASLLRERHSGEMGDDAKMLTTKINASADRMSLLIKTLLMYSRVSNPELSFKSTDLGSEISTAFEDLEILFEETGGKLVNEQKLPVIQAIPLQMHQLFHNLFTNALKFRQQGVPPVIKITWRTLDATETARNEKLLNDQAYIEIIVADNGIGFEQQFAEQVFQIFERLHSTEKFAGTGIGLALCKKIVENHHGDIFAVSKEGEGTAFHILLPFMPPAASNV